MNRFDLKKHAKTVGLSQDEIAELLGLHRVTVSNKFTGKTDYVGDVIYVLATQQVLTAEQKDDVRQFIQQVREGTATDDQLTPKGNRLRLAEIMQAVYAQIAGGDLVWDDQQKRLIPAEPGGSTDKKK